MAVTASNGTASAPATSAAAGPVSASSGDPVVVAVGDIACPAGDTIHACKQSATEAIAQKQNPNAVFVLGDNQYDDGSLSEYNGAGAYNSTWGFFNPIVHPVPGNHEYGTPGAAGYFALLRSEHRQPRRNERLLLIQPGQLAHRRAQLRLHRPRVRGRGRRRNDIGPNSVASV